MRKLALLLLAALSLQIQAARAQNRAFPNAIHAKLNISDYGLLFNNELRVSEGFEFAYFRNIAPFLNVGIPLKLGLAKLPNISGNTLTASGDLVFRLENMASENKIIPFAFGGGGYVFEKDNNHPQFPFGAGLHFRLSPYAFITLQGEFRKAFVDDRDNLQVGLGYVYLLHKMEKKTVLPPPSNDKDRDGVADALDKCPDQPGPAVALGCPDKDNDGVGDTEDNCPNDPGPLETNGCPDYDSDGTADKDDECPQEPGTWNGCPDADFDGIADKNDKCPTQAGPASNGGCPESKDSDGDGVADKDDLCPDKAGPNRGCPDSDGDGVADNFDNCPDKPGTVKNNGCPEIKDADGDGFPDEKDPCPTQPGGLNGCPDSDGDKVADNLDKCPNEAGPTTNFGCPEVKKEVKEKLATVTKAVQFETSRAVLKNESYAVLDEVVAIMREYPAYSLSISGHTDDVGSDSRNQRLSEDRAKACLDYLVFRGIKAERMRSAGFGEARPIATNDTPEGREQNRRVAFELVLE
jgi:outer membrane protein OmpA-like peptidoglycan-associated protein